MKARELGVFGALASLIAAAALGAAVTACQKRTQETWNALPDRRRYRLVTRSDHDPKVPAPLLFALHAYATPTDNLEQRWGLKALAVEARGYLLIVGEGNTDSHRNLFWNASKACCGTDRGEPDDLAYLKAALDDVRRRYAVDPARVYAFGVSNGGFMAYRVACDGRLGVTAIVNVAGAGQGPDDPPCTPPRPVSVLHVHGDDDEVIRYAGGHANAGRYPSAAASVRAWLAPNGCRADAEPSRARPSVLFELPFRAEAWACPHARVSFWTVPNGQHRLKLGIGFTNQALDFLEGKPLPAPR